MKVLLHHTTGTDSLLEGEKGGQNGTEVLLFLPDEGPSQILITFWPPLRENDYFLAVSQDI